MVFSSAVFLFVFLPITAFVYYFSAAQVKNYVLLIASLFFYAWGEPQYILLMLLSILINYVFGLIIEGIRGRKKDKLCSLLMCLAVVFNLALLGYYKYAGFLYENLNRVLPLNLDIPQVPLPIGISFYTFQILSYVIDVYRGNVLAQRNVLNLGLYISFFPQLIAGPIVRYIDIEAQIKSRQLSMDKVYEGLRCFTAGFAKKILLADQLAPLADAMFNASDISAPSAWVVQLLTHSKSTLTSADILTWPLVLEKSSVLNLHKTSITPISLDPSRNSGAGGIFPFPPGSRTMCIFPWEAAGTGPGAHTGT